MVANKKSLFLSTRFWDSFPIPQVHPEEGKGEKERRNEVKELADQLKSLRKKLMNEQTRLANIQAKLRSSLPGRNHKPPEVTNRQLMANADVPLVVLYNGLGSAHAAAARDAVLNSECQSNIIDLKQKIADLLAAQDED